MNKLEKRAGFVLVMLLVAGCVGCSGNTSGEKRGNGKETVKEDIKAGVKAEEKKNVKEVKETIVLQLAYENNPGEPFDLAANRWAELLGEASQGTMRIDLFPSGQLGTQDEMIDQIIAGENIITLADPGFYADRGVKDFGIMFGPYMFDTWEDVWKVTESNWYIGECEKLEKYGIKTIASNWMYGDRHTLSVKPIQTVEDLKGMKIRVPNTEIQIAGFSALGAVPTPMSLSEVYTSLQQKVIDGLENPLSTLYNGRFQEVAKYLILDGHVKDFSTLICNVDIYSGLNQDQQQWLTQTCVEAGIYNHEISSNMEDEDTKQFEDEGVQIVVPDQDVMEGFKEKAKAFYEDPQVTKDWSDGLYQTIQDILAQ